MATQNENQYDREKHNDYIICPRSNCGARNAPEESSEFQPNCWNCGTHLNIQPVERGETVEIDIFDIHESGAGVGRTEDGFIILVEGVLPEARVKAEITEIKDTFAYADEIERVANSISDDEEEDSTTTDDDETEDTEDSEDPHLGSRENYWG